MFGCIICLAVISFIIGLPTFLFGCNTSVSKECIGYNIFNGIVYKTVINEETCSSCIIYYDNGICQIYNDYSCWDAYVYAHYINNNNQTTSSCKLQTAFSESSEYNAEKSLDIYYIGENVNWYKKKGTNECEINVNLLTLWYVGVVFLSFTGLMILIGFIMFCFIAKK
jgi:hypothetical protein